MPKLGLWIDDELNDQIDQLHAAMKRRLEFRDLKLTRTDVFKMLIRRSIEHALLEHGVIPENLKRMDPDEILEALDKQNDEQRALIVRRLKQYHPDS